MMKNVTQISVIICLSLFFSSFAIAQDFFNEDFAGGIPDDWTNVEVLGNGQASSVWVYTTTGPAGAYAISPIASTSADNGWVLFDSDLNCNHPNPQEAWLISPVIDASGESSVFLTFETFYQSFNDRPQIRVGTDLNDLASWATYEVFPGVEANDFGGGSADINPQSVQIDISDAAAGEAAVHFAFQFLSDESTNNNGNLTGCGYAWQVDDVALTTLNPAPFHDLGTNFPRIPSNFNTPASQIDTIPLGFGIVNQGQNTQTNVSAAVDVTEPGGGTFNTEEFVEALEPDSSVLFVFDELYLPTEEGLYNATYTTAADSADQEPVDNTIDISWVISTDLFSKDDGVIAGATRPADFEDDFWEIGNYFFIPNAGDEAFEMQFSVASNDNAHQGQQVSVFLYKINEDDDLENFTDDDLEVVGFNTYTFTTEQNFDVVTAEILDLDSGEPGVILEEGTEYFLTIQYTQDMFVPYSELNYFYDVTTVVRGDNGGSDWFLGGFGTDVTAIVRMRVRPISTSTRDPQLASTEVKLFPNPANRAVTVSLDLATASEQVLFTLSDVSGKQLLNATYENIQKEQFNFDVSQYPAGTYFLHVRTAEGVKTERFVIQR